MRRSMFTTTLLSLVFVSLVFVSEASAEVPTPATAPAAGVTTAAAGADVLTRYHAESIQMRFSMWQGVKLQRGGKELKLGFFGGNARQIFAESARAMDAVGTYRKLKISGGVLWMVGLAALVGQMVALIVDPEIFIEEKTSGNEIKPLFWAILAPAAVVGITGGIMMQGANGYLNDAVSHYNDDVVRRITGRASQSSGLPRVVQLGYGWRF